MSEVLDEFIAADEHAGPPAARVRAWLCVLAIGAAATVSTKFEIHTWAWWALAGAMAIAAALLRGRTQQILMLLACGSLAGGWFVLRTETTRWDSVERFASDEHRTLLAAEGIVLSKPEPRRGAQDRLAPFRYEKSSTSFELRIEHVELGDGIRRASGIVRVHLTERSSDALAHVVPGALVRVKGWYLPPAASMNPGDGDRLRWARLSGRSGSISTTSAELVEVDVSGWQNWRSKSVRFANTLRERASSMLDGEASPGRAIMHAILLGEYDPALRETRSAFAATGTSHLLAISGFHLAVLCGIAALTLRLCGEHGGWETIVLAALILLVLILVPARVPIVRAGVMVLVLLLCDVLGRRYDRLTMLGWIAVGLFVWRPMDIFSMGAQLSVGITALLIWLGTVHHRWLGKQQILGIRRAREPFWIQLAWRLRGYLGVCLLCWAFSLPVVMCHTGQVNLTGALTTAVVTPLIVVLLGVGYLALFMHLVWPGSASAVMEVLVKFADLGGGFIERVASIDALAPVVAPPGLLWGSLAIIALWMLVRKARLWNWPVLGAIGLLILSVVHFHTGNRPLRAGVHLRIDALAVGNGSCYIVRSGREALLWDCGSLRSDLRPILERAQLALGVRTISLGIITHADLDHYISLPDAMDVFSIRRVLVPEHFLEAKNVPLRELHREIESRDVVPQVIARGDFVPFGQAGMTVLWPPLGTEFARDNDVSVVARIEVMTDRGVRRVLLTGDIEAGAMETLLEDRAWIVADVLEAPHHGSFSLKAWEFIEAVGPDVVMQSTGIARAGDERWSQAKRTRTWFTTAYDGAIWVEIMRDGTVRSGSIRRPAK